MDILKIDPDYDCADTDNRIENLPKEIQNLVKQNAEKVKGLKSKKPDQQEDTK